MPVTRSAPNASAASAGGERRVDPSAQPQHHLAEPRSCAVVVQSQDQRPVDLFLGARRSATAWCSAGTGGRVPASSGWARRITAPRGRRRTAIPAPRSTRRMARPPGGPGAVMIPTGRPPVARGGRQVPSHSSATSTTIQRLLELRAGGPGPYPRRRPGAPRRRRPVRPGRPPDCSRRSPPGGCGRAAQKSLRSFPFSAW